MTVVYVVDSSGAGDYLTVGAAISAVPDNPTDVYEIQLEDEVHDLDVDEDFGVSGCTATNFVHITAKPGAEATDWDTGAVLKTATSGHGFIVTSDYAKFSKVRMHQDSTQSSSEMIRCEAEYVWADRCFVEDVRRTSSRDGFQCAKDNTFMTVTNCIFRHFQRQGIRTQGDQAGVGFPDMHGYHNTFIDCGENSSSSADRGGAGTSKYSNVANRDCYMTLWNCLGDATGNATKTSQWRQFEVRNSGTNGVGELNLFNCIAGEPANYSFAEEAAQTDCHGGLPRTATEPVAAGTWMNDEGVLLGENAFTETQDVFNLTGHTFADSRISAADFATDITGTPRVSGGSVGAYAVPSTGTSLDVDSIRQNQTLESSNIAEAASVALDSASQSQTVESSGISEAASVALDSASQTQTVESSGISEAASVALVSASQSQTVESNDIAEAANVALDSASQTQTVESGDISEAASVALDSASQSQTIQSANVSTAANLLMQSLVAGRHIAPAMLTTSAVVMLNRISNANKVDSAGTFSAAESGVTSIRSANTLQATLLTESAAIALQAMRYPTIVQTVNTAEAATVAVARMRQINTLATVAISTSAQVTIDSIRQGETVGASGITEAALIALVELSQTNVLQPAELAIDGVLALDQIRLAPSLDLVALVEAASIVLQSVKAQSSSDAVALAQHTSLVVASLRSRAALEQTQIQVGDTGLALHSLHRTTRVSEIGLTVAAVLTLRGMRSAQVVETMRLLGIGDSINGSTLELVDAGGVLLELIEDGVDLTLLADALQTTLE